VPPGCELAASGVTTNVVAPDRGEIVAAPRPGAEFRHVDAGSIEKFPLYPVSDTVKDCGGAFGLVKTRHAGVSEKPAGAVPHANAVGVAEGVTVGVEVGAAVGDSVGVALRDGAAVGVPDAPGPEPPPPQALASDGSTRAQSQTRRRCI